MAQMVWTARTAPLMRMERREKETHPTVSNKHCSSLVNCSPTFPLHRICPSPSCTPFESRTSTGTGVALPPSLSSIGVPLPSLVAESAGRSGAEEEDEDEKEARPREMASM